MVAMLHNKTFVLSPVLTAVSGLSAFEAVLFLSLTLLSPLSGFVGAVGCSSLSLSLTVIVMVLVTEAPLETVLMLWQV